MSRSRKAKTPSERQLRLGELIRHAMAEIFLRTEIDDPDLAGVAVTVSEVRVSPDARRATVFVMPLGGLNKEAVVVALARHAKFLRGELARAVSLKYTPSLSFVLDHAFDQSEQIERLLRSPEVARDLGGPPEDD